MEIADILTETLKKEDREALLNLHRHLHGLAAQGNVDCERLTKAHELVAAEIVRRGYTHGSELECGKQKGLVLPAPHAFLVWKGKQTAVAASPEFHTACGAKAVDVPLALVCEGEAYGLVTLGTPAVMDCKTFDLPEFTEEHRVRPEERREWWPEAEKLFVYPIKDFRGFKELQRVDAGSDGDGLCEVRFKQYQPPSKREATVLRQSEKLPKVIVLQPHAVSLTGSVLYGKHEPADVDVVLVGAEWREDEGQFIVPLTPTFKEKLERVLHAVYQTGNAVQYISEGTGATFDHLPLYSLALVRLPRLEVERVSELESEFAEVGYDKVGEKYSPDQPRDEAGRFGGGGGGSTSASRVFESHETATKWLAESSSLNPELTSEEDAGLRWYKGDGYLDLNTDLRNYGETAAYEDELSGIDSAMSRSSVEEPVTVWRGMDTEALAELDGEDDLSGIEFRDRSFVSTTLDKGVGLKYARGGVLLEVRIPKGAKALNMERWKVTGWTKGGEAELLLNRDSTFRIVSDIEQAGKRNLVMELIQ